MASLTTHHLLGSFAITSRRVANIEELIERDPDELMQEAASDELFLADLNETMEDFSHAANPDDELVLEITKILK